MRWLVLIALAVCSGCLIVPREKVTDTVVSRGVADVASALGPVVLYASADERRVTVRVLQTRTCTHEEYVVVDRKTTVGADVEVVRGGGNPLGLLFVGMVATPVTGIITGIVVAASHDSTSRERQATSVVKRPCPLPIAHSTVELDLPSGTTLHAETDDLGHAFLDIPDSEPAGLITARAPVARPRTFRYSVTLATAAAP